MDASDVIFVLLVCGWALWSNRSIHSTSVRRSMARRKNSSFLARF
jgi:hypothetical protein